VLLGLARIATDARDVHVPLAAAGLAFEAALALARPALLAVLAAPLGLVPALAEAIAAGPQRAPVAVRTDHVLHRVVGLPLSAAGAAIRLALAVALVAVVAGLLLAALACGLARAPARHALAGLLPLAVALVVDVPQVGAGVDRVAVVVVVRLGGPRLVAASSGSCQRKIASVSGCDPGAIISA